MVQLADHERGRFVVRRCGPSRQLAPAAPSRPGLEPDPPDREAEAAGEQHGDGGRRVVPGADHGVEARVVVGDEVQHRVVARAGKRRPEGVGDGCRRSEAPEDERRRPQHRSDDLPVGLPRMI